MRIVIGIVVVLSLFKLHPAYANSYLEMITKAPEEQGENEAMEVIEENETSVQRKPDLWYDSRITTASPVVVSPYPKYYAWARAKANEYQFDRTQEQLQNLIYIIEGGLVGWGLYEIYKY